MIGTIMSIVIAAITYIFLASSVVAFVIDADREERVRLTMERYDRNFGQSEATHGMR